MKRFLLLLLCATMTFRITSFSSFAEGIVDVTESESVGMEANGTAESPSAIEETEAAESTGTIEETEATDDTSAIEETEGTSAVEETEAEESTSTIEETEATEDTSAIEETEGTSTVEKTEAVESTSAIEETEATEGTSAIEETEGTSVVEETEAVVSTSAIEEIEEEESTTTNDRTIVAEINADLAEYEPLDTPPADLLDEDAPDPASHIIGMGDNTVVSGWGYTFNPPEKGSYLIETVGGKHASVTVASYQNRYMLGIGWDPDVLNSYGNDGVNVEAMTYLWPSTSYIFITRDAIVDSFILRITRVELNYGQDDDDYEDEEFEDCNDCNDIIEEEEEEESPSEEELEVIDKNANSSAGETVTDNCVNSEKDPSTEPSTDKNLNPVKSPETGDSGVPFIYLPAMLAAGVLVFIERKRMIR